MRRELARQLISKAGEADIVFGHMLVIAEREKNEALRSRLQDTIYRLIGIMHENVVLPIVRRHPDLRPEDPPGLREDLRRRRVMPLDP